MEQILHFKTGFTLGHREQELKKKSLWDLNRDNYYNYK